MEVEVTERTVSPQTVEKLQADLLVLENDSADKHVVIDKLKSDLTAVEQIVSDREQVISLLEADIVAIKNRLDAIEAAKTGG